MFSVTNIESQVYNSSVVGDGLSNQTALSEDMRFQTGTVSLQSHPTVGQDHLPQASTLNALSHDSLRLDALSQKPIGQNSIGQSSIGHMGQR